jgi:HD-like signal output (HDOD) protein
MRLELLLKQPKALPTVPALALKLIATFEQEEPDLRLMSMDIAADPGPHSQTAQTG